MIFLNIRGFNKNARCLKVGAHFKRLQVSCLALLETRVKVDNSSIVRKKLGYEWEFIDNYEHPNNGRIWLAWSPGVLCVTNIEKTYQLIHCGVYACNGTFSRYLTTIYAHNQLANKKNSGKILSESVAPHMGCGL